jgi:hypothetical protein
MMSEEEYRKVLTLVELANPDFGAIDLLGELTVEAKTTLGQGCKSCEESPRQDMVNNAMTGNQ